MEFCEVCDNMLYVKTNEKKELVKYCKHCSYEKKKQLIQLLEFRRQFIAKTIYYIIKI